MKPLKQNARLCQVFAREEARRAAEGCQQLRKGMRFWKGRDSGFYSGLRSHYLALRAAWVQHMKGAYS